MELGRKPLILYAVIDNSGSMSSGCGGRNAEDDEFSRLDLVKHTLNTIISAMSDVDQISIIKFSTVAKSFAPLTRLIPAAKRSLMDRLESLVPEGQTNIWDGLRLAIDEISQLRGDDLNANVQVYLLTDGEPTITTPRSLPETVENYLRVKSLQVPIVFNTFGYGYSLDSRLLYDVAKLGKGSFGYIPDSSMVGTVFINALSNSLLPRRAELLQTSSTAQAAVQKVVQALTNALMVTGPGLPSPREVVQSLARDMAELLTTTRAGERESGEVLTFLTDIWLDCSPNTDASLGQVDKAVQDAYFSHWGRHYLFSVLSAYENCVCINFKDKGMQHFRHQDFIVEQTRIENLFIELPPPKPSNTRGWTNPLNRSFAGSSSNSMASFPFGSPQALMSTTSSSMSMSSSPAYVSRPTSSMSRFIDVHGGCFTHDVLVCIPSPSITNGFETVPFHSLRKGDWVMSQAGWTRVEAIIRLRYDNHQAPLYRIHGLQHMLLTAYHPVLFPDGTTMFPVELYQQGAAEMVMGSSSSDGYVYDVVLENRSILATPMTPTSSSTADADSLATMAYVATWAHSCKLPKFEHDYFGSERIVQDVLNQRPEEYAQGYVSIDAPIFQRTYQPQHDETRITQLICGSSIV